jgi:hypothetical protein
VNRFKEVEDYPFVRASNRLNHPLLSNNAWTHDGERHADSADFQGAIAMAIHLHRDIPSEGHALQCPHHPAPRIGKCVDEVSIELMLSSFRGYEAING